MKLHLLLVFGFITTISFCQKQNNEHFLSPLIIEKLDEFYELQDYVQYYIDKNRSLSFEEVKNKKFSSGEFPVNLNHSYWFKFKLKPNKEADFLLVCPAMSDLLTIYVPQINSKNYRAVELGQLKKGTTIHIDIAEASVLSNDYKSIDFSRPFYIKKEAVTDWGEIYFKNPMFVILTDNKDFIKDYMEIYSLSDKFQVYSIIIFMSFVFFLVNFLVSKDKNYLNYSLYLLTTVLIFIFRIPYVFNFFNSIEPKLFHYIRVFSIAFASGFYFYFVVSFLNFKQHFSKLYKWSIITLKGICLFTALYIILIIVFPFFPYKVLVMNIFKVSFTLISLYIFIFLLFKKGDKIYKAVLISSLLLILGNFLSIVTNSSFFFLNTVLIEIIIFTAIVSYNNKINSKKRFENKLLLEQEQINSQNLIEINEVKSKFFANISHEFRTPLTLISNPIDEIIEDETISEEKRQKFIMAKRNSDRLLSLVNQLLDLSKIDAGQLKLHIQKGNIQDLISGLAESFNYSAEQNTIDYDVNIEKKDEESWFDKDAVEKITVNLISNAIKYTPKNGSIICKSFIKNDKLYFSVKNTGTGLTKIEIENIFIRFYQTDEQNQGTGVGLALVKELVELHKGTIKVESNAHDWIDFLVILPVDKESFKNEMFIDSTKIDSTYKVPNFEKALEIDDVFENNDKPILLLVEDNNDIRTLLKQTFEADFNILTAENGQLGIDLALERVPDIIISDIMMPVKDGVTLTKVLKKNELTNHIPIILLTAKAGEINEIKGIEVGADDYITKPFNSKLLKTKAFNLLEIRRKLQSKYRQEIILTPKDVAIPNLDEQFLNKVQQVLEVKLTESCFSVEDFSKSVGVSRMQLHRKIKALTGLSASEFVRSQRLKLAAELLKTSNINISQVGYSVGFNDHSYFAKCFKETFNCTPTAYATKHDGK
ncbi:response regulator [Mariniflexile litorale]|uniref:histidine kinase n=1 Tax=Mariniflexile litorale TaxID=3045158 RepID=A0AAU7ECS6_9FLAO|nr:response regulator [Mariniflexile sp. KMM 9835]MDQ8212935.1 response regulator [Mariniflexile sp. KMM 9835]